MCVSPSRWGRLQRLENSAGEGPFACSTLGVDLVAVRSNGNLRVYEGRCPHRGALLGEGEIEGGSLVCRNHRWRFDIATGQHEGGPECLRACPVQMRNGEVWVDVSALEVEVDHAKPRRRLVDLPGPDALPLLGNALDLDVPRLHLVLEQWARTYGPIFKFRPGRRWSVAVSDPALIDQVLRARPETFRRDSRVEPVFAELAVAGVFSTEGNAWRAQRRLVMEALSQRNLSGFMPTLIGVAERLLRRWRNTAGTLIDLCDDLMRFTVDVTTSLVFGRDLKTLEGGEDVIQRDLSLLFPTIARRLIAPFPYWRAVRLPRDREVDRAVAVLRRWLTELIDETRARLARQPARSPSNFLEAMLLARDEQERPFSDETVLGNAMTMLLGGEDTTANSLAWAVHLLCDHPDEVAALRADTDVALGAEELPRDFEQAGRLGRATAVTHESMRLLPVGSVNFTEANVDTVLGDVEIPLGTSVVTLGRIAALDARHFADPDAFRPGRWIDSNGGNHDASVHLPFGSGPRICPGRSLALLEMRVVLAMLYRNFDVERVGRSSDVTERYAFTVAPSDLRVRLRVRPRPAAH
jgi:cytochrome P450/nitrite reductase/ring-hydroxylating ferredoxin subunit